MRRCPICKNRIEASTESRVAPFCSERCKLIDLGNWLGESYRIAGDEGVPLDEHEEERVNRRGAERRHADSPEARGAGGPRPVAQRSDPENRSGAERRPADSPEARSAGGPKRAVAQRSDRSKEGEKRERRRR